MKRYNNKILNYHKDCLIFIMCLFAAGIANVMQAQEDSLQYNQQDTTKVKVSYNKTEGSFEADSGYIQKEALDISSDRGLFILSPDRKMQMRILGSVRAAINYTDQDLENKSTLNPYEIPTNLEYYSPNYYASLSQTRIGFEITRKTNKYGNIFIRIETDFASQNNNLRLRHAYGQFTHFLVGQTWSLFTNVSYQPATVSFDGVVGSASLRTPQIRYYSKFKKIFNWAVAIEYSNPDFLIPDSVDVSLLQVIPDFTGQVSYSNGLFSGQFAGVIATISGRDSTDKISYNFAIGGSVSGQFTIKNLNKLYFSATSGRAISHFIGVFSGKLEDAAYNSETGQFSGLFTTSGFVAYSRELPHNLSASLSVGIAIISNKDFQSDDSFSHGYNSLLNVFWQPVEGARMGAEYGLGQRFDKGGSRGFANKLSLLLYYDF